jgi:nucleotide-binding universal stress UspA family protein
MGTIFVAYGEPDHRGRVLAFAADRAAASGDDLLVYHVQETADDDPERIRREVDEALAGREVDYRVQVNTHEFTERSNVSKQKRLVDAALGGDYEYAVMGNIERGRIEGWTLTSMSKAVLETHGVPVLLVPV